MAKKKVKTSKKKTPVPTEIAVPIEWRIPDGLITPYATNMTVQTLEEEFKVCFFEAKPIIRLKASEPLPNKITADYIAGVIISAKRLPKFIKALQDQLDKYNSRKQIK